MKYEELRVLSRPAIAPFVASTFPRILRRGCFASQAIKRSSRALFFIGSGYRHFQRRFAYFLSALQQPFATFLIFFPLTGRRSADVLAMRVAMLAAKRDDADDYAATTPPSR